MGLDIVSNIMAQEASNSLSVNEANMQSSLQKLSSGYQINKAADDASGLEISQHLQYQIGGFQQAQANTQSAINVVQTADGALNEVGTILQRINTLAVQSANTSATDTTAQQAAQAEVNQSLASISNIAQTTVYGTNTLLVNGTSNTVNYTFQVGGSDTAASQVAFSVTALNLTNLGLAEAWTTPAAVGTLSGQANNGTYALVVTAGNAAVQGASIVLSGGTWATNGVTFSLALSGGTAVTIHTNAASETLATLSATIAFQVTTAGYLATEITVSVANGTSVSITDDMGGPVTLGGPAANLSSIGLVAGTSYGSATVSFGGGAAVTLLATQNVAGSQTVLQDSNGDSVTLTAGANGLGVSTSAVATGALWSVTGGTAITVVDAAISTVSAMRGTFGAYQNELQHISDNETVMVQNLQASNADISDTNMASQMVNFTQDQVLVQAGVSMLAQANQLPQMVLKLLG